MASSKEVHLIDTDIRRAGNLAFVVGAGLLLFGGGLLVFVQVPFHSGLLLTFGLAAIGYGRKLCSAPTAGASVTVDSEGVDLTRDGSSVTIPWSDVHHWGLASRRVFGATSRFTRLVLWPVEHPTPTTTAAAKPLWNPHHRGWTLTTYEPAPELVAAFETYAPRPRQDAIARADW